MGLLEPTMHLHDLFCARYNHVCEKCTAYYDNGKCHLSEILRELGI